MEFYTRIGEMNWVKQISGMKSADVFKWQLSAFVHFSSLLASVLVYSLLHTIFFFVAEKKATSMSYFTVFQICDTKIKTPSPLP